MEVSARHRKCLQNDNLGGPNGENEAQLYTGDKVRQECIDLGWLERLPDSPGGFRMYRTTELGRAVLYARVAKKASKRPRIKMLKALVKTLEPRIKPLKTPR
ncbi:hypothetical protein ABIE85_000922 [Bradyrhizobium diazoefficiens]